MISAFGKKDVKNIPVLLADCKSDLEQKIDNAYIDLAVKYLREAGLNIVSYEKNGSDIEVFAKHHLRFNRMWEAEKWRTGPGWIKISSKLGTGVTDAFTVMKKELFEVSTFQREDIKRRPADNQDDKKDNKSSNTGSFDNSKRKRKRDVRRA